LFHADRRTDRQAGRQTDMTKLIVAFRCFAKVPTGVNLGLGRLGSCLGR